MKLVTLLFTVLFLLFGCGQHNFNVVSTPPTPQLRDGQAVDTMSGLTIPKHVLSAIYGYGYAGVQKTVSLTDQVPYVDWAYTDQQDASLYRAAGIKTLIYMNFWRNYKTDVPLIGYTDLKPGGAHAAAEAMSCTGTPSYDSSYEGGYLADPRKTSATLGHAKVVEQYRLSSYSGIYDAFFSDDTDGNGGVSPAPCNYAFSTWLSATNTIDADLGVKMFVNALNAWSTGGNPAMQVPVVSPSNVLGAMCESCYVNNTAAVGGTAWQQQENAEIGVVANHKIFWEYARNTQPATTAYGLRTYAFASFLLTYDPRYAMYQPAFATPSAFEVMPEQGLVPMDPVTAQSNVTGYMTGAVAERRFFNCYYRGNLIGSCAVAINTGTSSAAIPVQYPNSMVLTGGGVYEGGQANFTGPKLTTLAPHSAAILIGGVIAPTPTPTLAPTPVPTPTPTTTYSFVKTGTIGGILETNLTVQFGAGCGWTHVYDTGAIMVPTGYVPKVNDTITVYGTGGCTINGVQAQKIVKD